jgi:hypothetical protein
MSHGSPIFVSHMDMMKQPKVKSSGLNQTAFNATRPSALMVWIIVVSPTNEPLMRCQAMVSCQHVPTHLEGRLR